MSQATPALRLVCPPFIHWVKDIRQVLVVNEKKQETWVFTGFEAAVWDMVMLGYPYERLVKSLSTLANFPPAQIEQDLLACIEKWRAAGILEIQEAACD